MESTPDLTPALPTFSDSYMVSHTGERFRILLWNVERPTTEPSNHGYRGHWFIYQSLVTGMVYVRPASEIHSTVRVDTRIDEKGEEHHTHIRLFEVEHKPKPWEN